MRVSPPPRSFEQMGPNVSLDSVRERPQRVSNSPSRTCGRTQKIWWLPCELRNATITCSVNNNNNKSCDRRNAVRNQQLGSRARVLCRWKVCVSGTKLVDLMCSVASWVRMECCFVPEHPWICPQQVIVASDKFFFLVLFSLRFRVSAILCAKSVSYELDVKQRTKCNGISN